MIDFNCVHCGNRFRVAEEHAGRNGWCKVCKGSVAVPMALSSEVPTEHQPDLPQLRNELEALKATRAELQSRLEVAEPLAARVEEIEADHAALSQRADEAERERSELKQALQEAIEQAETFQGTLEEDRGDVERLTQALDEERRGREAAESALHDAEAARGEAATANRELEATVEQLRLEREAAALRTESLEREFAEARERIAAMDALEASLAKAEERLGEMNSRVEQVDSEITRELEAAEDLAVDTADGLKRLSEVLVGQQTMLERLESEDAPAEEPGLAAIPLALAPDEEEPAEPAEVASETPDEHESAVADAFLRFIERQ